MQQLWHSAKAMKQLVQSHIWVEKQADQSLTPEQVNLAVQSLQLLPLSLQEQAWAADAAIAVNKKEKILI